MALVSRGRPSERQAPQDPAAAAAALPVVAQNVIKTDTDGLTAGTVTVTVNGTAVPVYRAQPAGKTGLPVILVISEIFGVH
eukprot:gene17795-36430_t